MIITNEKTQPEKNYYYTFYLEDFIIESSANIFTVKKREECNFRALKYGSPVDSLLFRKNFSLKFSLYRLYY